MSLRAQRSNLPGNVPLLRDCFVAEPVLGRRGAPTRGLLAMTILFMISSPWPARAAEPQHCARAEIALWGDGRHDDTAALNAWLRGEDAAWAASGHPGGTAIAGRSFRL